MYNPILAAGLSLTDTYLRMKPALTLLLFILSIMILCCIVFTILGARIKTSRRSQRRTQNAILRLMYIVTALVFACTMICVVRYRSIIKEIDVKPDDTTQASTGDTTESNDTSDTSATETTEQNTEATESVTEPTFTPEANDSSDPKNWNIKWEIITGGSIVNSYNREDPISFGAPDDYFALPGIATFRGNNFRNSPVYGTTSLSENTLTKAWGRDVGSLNGWPGCGWTGQPLMVQWDAETKAIMNMYQSKIEKEGLVEVIYATLDGYIYFYDLEDGSYTRDPINVGMNFKGAGALDPRGYPLMYVGSGDYLNGKTPRMYIISLIDGKILYEYSGADAFSQRSWAAFDSSPLVDAKTDTLIWPGESGLLYTFKLNTNFDKSAGTLTIAPEDMVKTRYTTGRSNGNTYWIGYEPSAVIVDRYLYISENGGMFFCIDLDTMELIWAQDTRDDSNSTPVFEWNVTDGGYLYTAPSLHWTNKDGSGYICIYKLDAKTGEIVWEQRFDCYTYDGVSGGVQSSPLLGKPGTELEGLILYTVARCPNFSDGKLVALDTQTGDIVWEKYMNYYAWSSPVAVYDDAGKANIIICDSVGNMSMLDSKGNTLTTIGLGSNIEASPAVFNDTLVVGTRGGQVYGIKIK